MKQMIRYGSPKQYQKGWESESNSNPAKLKKPKSKYCKFLKGPHQYGDWKPVQFAWTKKDYMTGLWERFCVRCNRKDWWSAPNLPGPYWELDKDARPPGYKQAHVAQSVDA